MLPRSKLCLKHVVVVLVHLNEALSTELHPATAMAMRNVITLEKGCVSLNPKESENGFCVSSLDRSIKDLSDHGASKNPISGFFGFFDD